MIIRKDEVHSEFGLDGQAQEYGEFEQMRYSDSGGLNQYGPYVYTLKPGSRSSDRHWHEQEDEFLYALTNNVTVVENDGEHQLNIGDAACWPAGEANAHFVINKSTQPCRYLIVGTRVTHDICHYPDLGKILHTEAETWRMVSDDGELLGGGKVPWAED